MNIELNYNKLRSMIARCEWTFAKTMPFAPHEYIVKDKCPLAAEDFEYFVNMQREHGVKERWGKYNNPYLYIDDYKYWTMGAPIEETTVINRAKVHVLKETITLYEDIKRIKAEVRENSPHSVNTITDLDPGEPKVSSILGGFFKQRKNGRYYVLEDFVKKYFGLLLALQIEKPVIETEETVDDKKRIDILVYEKGKYAIVFENKIWDAEEQKNQLANYIKGMKAAKYGIPDENIYVVYLPSTDVHGPTDKSWNKSLQEKFALRYRNVSFKEGILDWLTSESLAGIDDETFQLSRLLFIDYLKRKFNLTEIDNMEKIKTDDYIRQVLGLSDNNNSQNIAVLTGKINEINDCVGQLERMRREYCYAVVKDICVKLERDYPNYTILKDFKPAQCIYTGIAIPYKDIKDAINILIGFEGKNFIYGVTYAPNYGNIRKEMQESERISSFYSNGEFKKGFDWLFYKGVGIEDGYKCFRALMERLL